MLALLHPFVRRCVALVVNKTPLVGVVYNPVSREMFTAVVGGGAYVMIEGQDVPPQRLQREGTSQQRMTTW